MIALIEKLIELFRTNSKLCIISAVVGIAIGWSISDQLKVGPKQEQIVALKEESEKYKQIVRDLNSSNEPFRKQIEQLEANNKKLGNDLEASQNNLVKTQDTIKILETYKSELEKKLSGYENNGNILSEIRKLEERKASIDNRLTGNKGELMFLKSGQKPEPHIPTYKEEQWQRQSDELHTRILDLQRQLQCQPK